jgi:hypothetical protein
VGLSEEDVSRGPWMSIFATWWSADETEHLDTCAFWKECEPGIFERSGQACSIPERCVGAPFVYGGSHLVPDPEARGGWVEVGGIPSHIAHESNLATLEQIDYLRIGIGVLDGADFTVLLNRKQVEELTETLQQWLVRDRSEV